MDQQEMVLQQPGQQQLAAALQPGQVLEVQLHVPDMAGEVSPVKTWAPAVVRQLGGGTIWVELQHGIAISVTAEQLRPTQPDGLGIESQPSPGEVVEVFWCGRWWPVLLCCEKQQALAVMSLVTFSLGDVKRPGPSMRKAFDWSCSSDPAGHWQPRAAPQLAIDFATGGYTATPEGKADPKWQARLCRVFTGVNQRPPDIYPVSASMLRIPRWQNAAGSPFFLGGDWATELAKFVVGGSEIPGALPPCSTASFVMAWVRDEFKLRGGADMGSRQHTSNFHLPDWLKQQVFAHVGWTAELQAEAEATARALQPRRAVSGGAAAAVLPAAALAEAPAVASHGRLSSPKRGRDLVVAAAASGAGVRSILGSCPAARQATPAAAAAADDETPLPAQQCGISSSGGAGASAATRALFDSPAAEEEEEGVADGTGSHLSKHAKKLKALLAAGTFSASAGHPGTPQQQQLPQGSRAEPAVPVLPPLAAAALAAGHYQSHSSTQATGGWVPGSLYPAGRSSSSVLAPSAQQAPSAVGQLPHPQHTMQPQVQAGHAPWATAAGTHCTPPGPGPAPPATSAPWALQAQPGASGAGQALPRLNSLASLFPTMQVSLRSGFQPAPSPTSPTPMDAAPTHTCTDALQEGLGAMHLAGGSLSLSGPSGSPGRAGGDLDRAALLCSRAYLAAAASAPAAAAAAADAAGTGAGPLQPGQHPQHMMAQQQQRPQLQQPPVAPPFTGTELGRIRQLVSVLQLDLQAPTTEELKAELRRCKQLPLMDGGQGFCYCCKAMLQNHATTMYKLEAQRDEMDLDEAAPDAPFACRTCFLSSLDYWRSQPQAEQQRHGISLDALAQSPAQGAAWDAAATTLAGAAGAAPGSVERLPSEHDQLLLRRFGGVYERTALAGWQFDLLLKLLDSVAQAAGPLLPVPAYDQLGQAKPRLLRGAAIEGPDGRLPYYTQAEVAALLESLDSNELLAAADRRDLLQRAPSNSTDVARDVTAALRKKLCPSGVPYLMVNLKPSCSSKLGFPDLSGRINADLEHDKIRPSLHAATFRPLAEAVTQELLPKLQEAGGSAAAGPLRAVLQALKLRFCEDQLVTWDPVKQSLLLVTLQPGNGSIPHIDPAAALNDLFAIVKQGPSGGKGQRQQRRQRQQRQQQQAAQQQQQQQHAQQHQPQLQQQLEEVMAEWFFLNPLVMSNLQPLRLLLAVLSWLQSKQAGLAAAEGSEKTAAEKEFAAYQQLSEQQALKQQLAGQLQPADKLWAGEAAMLQQLLSTWRPTLQEARIIAGVMGPDYALILQQRAGDRVEVAVGWLHVVFNLQPCLKLAYEVLRPQDAAGCVLMHQRVRRCFDTLPDDYMGVVHHATKELLYWAKQV